MGKSDGGSNFGGGLQKLHRDWTGVTDQARAAGGAARAAEAEARRQREESVGEARGLRTSAMSSAQSIQELNAYEQSLGYAQKQADADQKLIDSIDPSLMEASKQVLGLLKGDTSGVGNALGNQRATQRQKLLASLREQLGPGAETSTAGIQALTRFDSESANLGAQTQNQSLGSLMGMINGRPVNQGAGSIANIGQLFGSRANRLMTTDLQSGQNILSAMSAGNQGVMNTVGSQYTEQLIRGRGQQQDHKTGVEFMGSMFGGMSGGGGK